MSFIPITVFTPTFNRAHTLRRLHKSLLTQDHTIFEWLIIDDGSTDNTQDLLKELKIESPFPMRWIYQENGGKHRAHNVAVKMAESELTIIMDSDDTFTENAINLIWKEWQSIPKHDQNNYAGIWGNCVNEKNEIIGDKFPKDRMDGKILKLTINGHLIGEKLPCFRTDILQRFPFPQRFQCVEHVPEGIVWLQISEKYTIRFVNYPLRIYHRDPMDDDAMMNKVLNPTCGAWGKMIYYSRVTNLFNNYFPHNIVMFLKMGMNVSRFGYHAKISLLTQLGLIKYNIPRLIWLFSLPLGLTVAIFDRLRNRSNG